MKVYIANFGSGNWAWPNCLERHAIAVMDDMRVHPYWQRGDHEGYVREAMRILKTMKGKPPTRSVATRWYNVNTILRDTAGDLWVHREKNELWWTISTAEPSKREIMDDPDIRKAKVKIAVYYKRCNPWSNKDRKGRELIWAGLHPKARDFLFTEGTFQEPEVDNARYAEALIDGLSLSEWHGSAEWRSKEDRSRKGAVKTFSPEEILAERDLRGSSRQLGGTGVLFGNGAAVAIAGNREFQGQRNAASASLILRERGAGEGQRSRENGAQPLMSIFSYLSLI